MKPIVHMGLKVQPRIANNEASIELQKYGFTFLLETMGVNLFDKEKGEKKKEKKKKKKRKKKKKKEKKRKGGEGEISDHGMDISWGPYKRTYIAAPQCLLRHRCNP